MRIYYNTPDVPLASFYITLHNKGQMSADLTCLGSPLHWSSLALQYQINGPGKMKHNI